MVLHRVVEITVEVTLARSPGNTARFLLPAHSSSADIYGGPPLFFFYTGLQSEGVCEECQLIINPFEVKSGRF
jgi:hypothetical protein